MTVRTNFVEADFAMLNGAPTFLTLAGDRGPRPHEVTLELPPAWKTSISRRCPMRPAARRIITAHRTTTRSSIRQSSPATRPSTRSRFRGAALHRQRRRRRHLGRAEDRSRDVEQIVETVAGFWGTIPYDKYVFFNLITESQRRARAQERVHADDEPLEGEDATGYVDWLTLVAHEFFHAWNVKRLRPSELGPFDYDRENPTRIAVGGRGHHQLLRRSAGRARGRHHPRRILERARQSDRRIAIHAWPPLDAGGGRLVRRVDQLLPTGRELAERRDQLLHQRCALSDSCWTSRSGEPRTTPDRSTT